MTDNQAKHIALSGFALERLQHIERTLNNLKDLACVDGTWNYSPYFQGMANGVLAALSVVDGKPVNFMSAPEHWIVDNVVKADDRPTSQVGEHEKHPKGA